MSDEWVSIDGYLTIDKRLVFYERPSGLYLETAENKTQLDIDEVIKMRDGLTECINSYYAKKPWRDIINLYFVFNLSPWHWKLGYEDGYLFLAPLEIGDLSYWWDVVCYRIFRKRQALSSLKDGGE